MTASEFCVVCGRSGLPLVDGVCADCFARRAPLLRAPAKARVVLCPTCGARHVRQHWERAGASRLLTSEDLTPLLLPHPEVGVRRVQWQEMGGSTGQREYEGHASVNFRGTERSADVRMTVKVDFRTCPECSRRTGHYYTALLQLRGPEMNGGERPRELRARLEKSFDKLLPEVRPEWRGAISWREERPEGWDYYLVDTLAARALAKHLKARLGAELKESATLYGRRDGRDVYRVTFCVRIPSDSPSSRPGRSAEAARERRPRPVER